MNPRFTFSLLLGPIAFLTGCTLVLAPSRRVGDEDAASPADASSDAPTMDAAMDAPAPPLDAGLDAPPPALDAPSPEDALAPADAFVAADAFAPLDAFTPTDAFVVDDAFVADDAFAPLDAFTPADAFTPVDAFTPSDAFRCELDDTTCDGIDSDCDGISDTDPRETLVQESCGWRCAPSASGPPSCNFVATVAAGGHHTCIVTSPDRELWCWGVDASGQLPGIDPPVPTTPIRPALSTVAGVLDVCAYSHGTCYLQASSVTCVGSGQPAAGGTWTRAVNATDVACSANHVCVVREDGRVLCAGLNGNGASATGQVGVSPVGGSALGPFVELQEVGLPAGTVANQVEVGTNFSCAMVDRSPSDGSSAILCWGANDVGQLGRTTMPVATEVPDVVAGTLRFKSLATAQFTACATTGSDGGATPDTYCWGFRGDAGVIGQSAISAGVFAPTADPAGPHGFSNLFAGPRLFCASDSMGWVNCWGSQVSGEFGVSPRSAAPFTSVAPVLNLANPGAARVVGRPLAIGNFGTDGHVCAAAGGALRCWGSNTQGQVGVSAASPVLTAVPVRP